MFKIALIQNQSEMAHYGYADARPIVEDLGYESFLYTADNIDTLGASLVRNQFDAVVLASNALNDKRIREEIENPAFYAIMHEWLKSGNGKGLLSFHQLRLAADQIPNTIFLPPPYDKVAAKIRPKVEKSAQGNIFLGSNADKHTLLLYPNKINPLDLKKELLNFKSLPGLYWHYWSNENLSDWEVLLTDQSNEEVERPLVLASRDPSKGRIILSSLTLDWQKQRDVIENFLTYVVEGPHNTAFLFDEGNKNTAFDYLIGTLESRKYPFQMYSISSDLKMLENHLKTNVHTVLVLGPFVTLERLSEGLSKKISSAVEAGSLKLISIESTDRNVRKFSITGRERSALRLLNTAELQIQSELRKGYIDGSFWNTAETLQILQNITQSDSNFNSLVGEALKIADTHDRDGSYDEVFGVTCAFLWMRGTYEGIESAKTLDTVNWIRERIQDYDPREQIQAYLTFIELEIITKQEEEVLTSTLLRVSTQPLSENDIVVYLKAAVVSKYTSVVNTLISTLDKKQKSNGSWVDLATTATAITVLIDALKLLRTDSSSYSALKPSVERMLFQGIIHIQNNLDHDFSLNLIAKYYPWDGKANTTAKCILAWMKFEDLIELPVYEIVETLTKYNSQSTSLRSDRQALSILEELKEDNSKIVKQYHTVSSSLEDTEKVAKKSRMYLLLLLVTIYCFISSLVGILNLEGWAKIVDVIKASFINVWGFHLTVFGLILALPVKNFLKNKIGSDNVKS